MTAAKVQAAAPSSKLASFQGRRALVAEDNRANQVVISAMLRKLGVEADIVSNGRQAVEACKNGRYDIYIQDYSMPVMNGVEALQAILGFELSRNRVHTFAVVCTANTMSFQVEEYLREGFDVHLSKPLALQGVKKVLALAFEGKAALPSAGPGA
ncbi:response regulator [Leisingera methylohalidivorans]|uniref:response regulator n=1 Tax=Leisingera methylohalidivorans TaxID=133924 RepID=UPI0012EBE0A4|nr:response regulator [Leisingera methylohalidivorans]